MSFIAKFEEVDRRIVYLLMIIVVVIPILRLIGLPILTGERSRTFRKVIDALPAGSVVWYGVDTGMGGWPELKAAALGVAQHLFLRPVKIMFVSFALEGPMIYELLIKTVSIPPDKKYGTDYVYLGFFAGGETAIAALAADIHKLAKADHYGTPLTDLLMMKDLKSVKDFALAITVTPATDTLDGYVRQLVAPYGTKYAIICLGVMGPAAEPFYPAQAVGLMVGARVGAEYELLIGRPGPGLASMDAQSMAHALAVIFIVLGNLGYFYIRKVKGGAR